MYYLYSTYFCCRSMTNQRKGFQSKCKAVLFVGVTVALATFGPGLPTLSAYTDFLKQAVAIVSSPKDENVARLAVVSICTDGSPYANNTLRLNQVYCRLHGCDYIRVPCLGKGEVDRVHALLEFLKQANETSHSHSKYEYVMWMDCDAAFVNPFVSVERVLSHFDEEKQVGMMLSRHAEYRYGRVQGKWQQLCRKVNDVTGNCNINSGVFVVRCSQAGMAALEDLRALLGKHNQQVSFDQLVLDEGEKQRQGHNASVKALFADVMNRHVPPLGFYSTNQSGWTVREFQKLHVWSKLPTLVIHPYGQFHLRTEYFECVVKALLVGLDDKDGDKDGDGYIDHKTYSADNYTEVAIDRCAWVFGN
jgi:galactosyl transferase GMA12/MNN10 family